MPHNWLMFALGSALFAGLTAIYGKIGVSEINSNLATLIRTAVILAITAGIVSWRNDWQPLDKLSGKAIAFLVLSSVATGLSWLCYYRALQLGNASQVAPVDKLSLVFVMLFAWLFLGEKMTGQTLLGGLLVVSGVLVLAIK